MLLMFVHVFFFFFIYFALTFAETLTKLFHVKYNLYNPVCTAILIPPLSLACLHFTPALCPTGVSCSCAPGMKNTNTKTKERR